MPAAIGRKLKAAMPIFQATECCPNPRRTADLISLRVIFHALQGVARVCKWAIFKGVSFLCLALCCTVLRSRWCQSGVNGAR
jgi:hypothetical protein